MTHYLPIVGASGPDGEILDCSAAAPICGYHCCHQQLPKEGPPVADESILLFPGERELALEQGESAGHIEVTGTHPAGGDFGYCNPHRIDQRQCHPSRNFKPLDCRSYPLFPTIRDGRLALLIDTRCPLSARDPARLKPHAQLILASWQREVERNPAVGHWLASLELPTYEPFSLDE